MKDKQGSSFFKTAALCYANSICMYLQALLHICVWMF